MNIYIKKTSLHTIVHDHLDACLIQTMPRRVGLRRNFGLEDPHMNVEQIRKRFRTVRLSESVGFEDM